MMVPFHILAAAAIAHLAVASLKGATDPTPRAPGIAMIAAVGVLAVLSHGILDGLKHGYPLSPLVGTACGALLGIAWCLMVRPHLALLFVVAMAGSIAPDVIDLGPEILREQTGIALLSHADFFPWHWRQGSGSMEAGDPDRARDLRVPRNQAVSYTNHAIVLAFSIASILRSPGAFRWGRPDDRPRTG